MRSRRRAGTTAPAVIRKSRRERDGMVGQLVEDGSSMRPGGHERITERSGFVPGGGVE
jgi:hypothetical protein